MRCWAARISLAVLIAAVSATTSWAACTSPAGAASQTRYDSGANKLYYCNNSTWVATGGGLNDLTNVSASSPSNGDVLTYNGSVWVNLAAAAGGSAGLKKSTFFTSSGTWTKASGTTRILVFVQGGGGGGAGVTYAAYTASGGGAGGICIKFIDVTSVSSESFVIGAGGNGGGANAHGVAGSASSFGAHCTANGGARGTYGNNTTAAGGAGGTATGGDINMRGASADLAPLTPGFYDMGGGYVQLGLSSAGAPGFFGGNGSLAAATANSGAGGSGYHQGAGYSGGSGFVWVLEF